jgi:H+/Cl- antiporter ClcA
MSAPSEGGNGVTGASPPPVDPGVIVRSRKYRALLVAAAVVGVGVSFLAWCFLEAVHGLQLWVYEDLPDELGFDSTPTWWPLPVLAVAGVMVGFAIARLPGRGGHEPSEGLKTGKPTQPNEVPGIFVAGLASLALGFVVGPEAPLIALGMGIAAYAVRRAKRDAPDTVVAVLASAAAFAAISTIFGSPIVGAMVIIEAAGIGGPMLPLILLPGLIAAGIGSLVFIGMGDRTGLSTAAWELHPLPLPSLGGPDLSDFAWTVALAPLAAAAVFLAVEIGRRTARIVALRPVAIVPLAGLLVAALAIVFHELTDKPSAAVLFSGETSLQDLFVSPLAISTLVALLVCKGLAWGVSLGSARGGPTFPAIFLGAAAGLVAAHLPGYAESQAVGVLMGAACVAVLRLPLTSVLIAFVLSSQAGTGVIPLIIVAVAIAYITVELLAARFPALEREDEASAAAPAAAGF